MLDHRDALFNGTQLPFWRFLHCLHSLTGICFDSLYQFCMSWLTLHGCGSNMFKLCIHICRIWCFADGLAIFNTRHPSTNWYIFRLKILKEHVFRPFHIFGRKTPGVSQRSAPWSFHGRLDFHGPGGRHRQKRLRLCPGSEATQHLADAVAESAGALGQEQGAAVAAVLKAGCDVVIVLQFGAVVDF